MLEGLLLMIVAACALVIVGLLWKAGIRFAKGDGSNGRQ